MTTKRDLPQHLESLKKFVKTDPPESIRWQAEKLLTIGFRKLIIHYSQEQGLGR
jgi:hypothetical protein